MSETKTTRKQLPAYLILALIALAAALLLALTVLLGSSAPGESTFKEVETLHSCLLLTNVMRRPHGAQRPLTPGTSAFFVAPPPWPPAHAGPARPSLMSAAASASNERGASGGNKVSLSSPAPKFMAASPHLRGAPLPSSNPHPAAAARQRHGGRLEKAQQRPQRRQRRRRRPILSTTGAPKRRPMVR